MNAQDRNLGRPADEAILHYGDGEYAVMKPGRYVTCAVSGVRIPLEALRYWSPVAQEAYAGPAEALARFKELQARG
jgi:hypothetical protein